jgi:hypothetical protein
VGGEQCPDGRTQVDCETGEVDCSLPGNAAARECAPPQVCCREPQGISVEVGALAPAATGPNRAVNE